MQEGGLRRRGVGAGSQVTDTSRKALDRLKSIDIYTKVEDDCMQKSQTGGVVTLAASIIMCMLFWNVLVENSTVEVVDRFFVDTRLKQKLNININVTFPQIRCIDIAVDAVDGTGDGQVDVHYGMDRYQLNNAGRPLPEIDPATGNCYPCIEAEDEEHECCGTCEKLKNAYDAKQLEFGDLGRTAPQCVNAVGCRLSGSIKVSKVSGNVHLTVRRSAVKDWKHLLELHPGQEVALNTSHEIDMIKFGDSVPGMHGPLDGTAKVVRHGAYMFHYYFKLVPMVYKDLKGNWIHTHEYSVSQSSRNALVRGHELTGLPGIFLIYDFNPFLVVREERAMPFVRFLTQVCAIIGGAFSVASMLEMLLMHARSQFMSEIARLLTK
mmetsp:Transcript_147652/g.375094  ORF Transcript_147652/g.375094 Transcript_147652/m.375094 type:complete len:379 (-) Transcript_147652:60-1196(-)